MLATLKAPVNYALRATIGNTIAAKQDRADNAARMAKLVGLRAIDRSPLKPPDFVRVGEQYDIEPWKLHGLSDQEVPNGNGFDQGGRLMAVPELHQWTKRTAHAYDKLYPDFFQDGFIAPSRVGPRHPYRIKYNSDSKTANEARWAEYIAPMAAINFDKALESCSWGAFQFMGFNWRKLVGPTYESAFEVIQYLYSSQRAQLDVACRLLIADNGFEALRRGDWTAFAKVQNGSARPIAYGQEVAEKANARRSYYA